MAKSKELIVDASHAGQKILLPGEPYRVLIVGGVSTEENATVILDIKEEDAKNCVCICFSRRDDIISQIRDMVAQLGSVALLTLQAPSHLTDFPVFVISDDLILDFFQYSKCVEATFELHEYSPFKAVVTSSCPADNVKTNEEDDFLSSVDLKLATTDTSSVNENDIYSSASKPSYVDAARSHPKNNCSTPSNVGKAKSTSQSSKPSMNSRGASTKEPTGVFSSLLSKAKDFVHNFLPEKEIIFKTNFKSDQKTNENCYGHALEKMQLFYLSQQIEAVKEFVKTKPKEKTLGHVAAAAYICNRSNDLDLKCDVLKCIFNLALCRDDLVFLNRTKPKKCPQHFVLPQKVLYTFLSGNVNLWGSNDQVKASSFDDGKWKCLVLLDVCGLTRKAYTSDEWKLLRNYIDPKIFVNKARQFRDFLGEERTFTLRLCFQNDYYDFLELARPGNVSSVKLETITFSILSLLVEEQLNKGLRAFATMWPTFLEMRRTVSFTNVGLSEVKIFSIFLSRIDFDSRDAVEAVSELIAVNNVDYASKTNVKNDLEAALLRFMNSNKITSRNFSHFLGLPLQTCIRRPALFDAMDHVMKKLINTSDAFKEKLPFN
jgi:hypothetical protein